MPSNGERDAVAVLEGVRFGYSAGHPVLDGIDLAIRPGQFVALVGPNGSGKSTLLRLLLGLASPDAGQVRLFGHRPGDPADRGRVGYVPQRPNLGEGVAASVADLVSSGRLARLGWRRRPRAADRAAVDAALDAVGLGDHRDRRLRELSGGQQQRAFIARALAGEPELLVLDEPVAGVDVESQALFRRSLVHLQTLGGTVLLVSHELGAVADALDRVVVLKSHIRFDGPPAELAASGVSLGVHRDDLPVWLEGVR